MNLPDPVTYYFKRPSRGTVRNDDLTASWTLAEVTFNYLTADQLPPEFGFLFNCHNILVDEDGEPIPVETLVQLDLKQGVRAAIRRNMGAALEAVGWASPPHWQR
jgi:hypothetical protein